MDFITFHIPLTDATRGSVNAEKIAKMKDGAVILNYSRGELADNAAVTAALESGKLRKYVVDFPSDEMIGVPGAICIPHLGASTPESEENCADMAAAEIRSYLEYGCIHNSVNFPELPLGQPEGARVLVLHENVPNMISTISAEVSKQGINIDNLINKSRKDMAATVMEMAELPGGEAIEAIRNLPGVLRVRTFG